MFACLLHLLSSWKSYAKLKYFFDTRHLTRRKYKDAAQLSQFIRNANTLLQQYTPTHFSNDVGLAGSTKVKVCKGTFLLAN